MRLRHYVSMSTLRRGLYIPRTLGSIRSWQYDSAVSEMATSSSVSKLFALSGSFQSNDTGACRCRLPIAAGRMVVFSCLAACLQNGRSIVDQFECQESMLDWEREVCCGM
jgi:hypothetical protein